MEAVAWFPASTSPLLLAALTPKVEQGQQTWPHLSQTIQKGHVHVQGEGVAGKQTFLPSVHPAAALAPCPQPCPWAGTVLAALGSGEE